MFGIVANVIIFTQQHLLYYNKISSECQLDCVAFIANV